MTRPIRVLQVMSRLQRTGIETFLMHVLRNLDRTRFTVDVAVHGDEVGAHEPEVRDLGSRIFHLPRPPDYLRWWGALDEVLASEPGYDVVHAHVEHLSGLVMLAAWLRNVPGRITHCHIANRAEVARARPLRRVFQASMLAAIHLGMTRGLSCVEAGADVLFPWAWGRGPRTEVLPYPIDVAPYRDHRPSVEGKAARRAQLGIPAGAPVLVHVGRFSEQKNHLFLLAVLAQIVARRPDARLLLLGDGPLRASLESEARRLGVEERVVFAGVRPDVPQVLLEVADAFVMPSRWEGLPLACMEAQAAGVPTFLSTAITAEASLVPALVSRIPLDAGPAAWAEHVLAALAEVPRVSRREACAALAASPVDIGRCVGRLEEIYTEAAKV